MAVIATLVLGTLSARLIGWLGVDYVDSWLRPSPSGWRRCS
jgi:hypothetical protein